MRWLRSSSIGFLLALLAGGGWAQGLYDGPLQPLQNGKLTVWVIGAPGTVKPRGLAVAGLNQQTPITYQEQTSGSFGQTASSYGGVSSSTGVAPSSPSLDAPPSGTGFHEQTSGSFGQPSSDTGTASSNHGQTASTLGTAASNHGQTAGSYGHPLSALSTAGSPRTVAAAKSPYDSLQREMANVLQSLQVKYVSVDSDELRDRLLAAEGTEDYPDLLWGYLPVPWYRDMQSQFGVSLLMPAFPQADHISQTHGVAEYVPRQYALLLRAPHSNAARALIVWMSEVEGCTGCVLRVDPREPDTEAVVKVAKSATERLARGGALGELADPAMAEFDPRAGWYMVPFATQGDAIGVQDNAPVRVEAMERRTWDRLAVVTLRVTTSSERVFGVSHPLLILRKQDDGTWRVLHVSLNLPGFQQRAELDAFASPRPNYRVEADAGPKGISQAAPLDGDVRAPMPDLWWDNLGGAGLQVVEWQQAASPAGWFDPHLFLIRDREFHLQTRVRADFAAQVATYRWRVWSVGDQGQTVVSPWRTFRTVR